MKKLIKLFEWIFKSDPMVVEIPKKKKKPAPSRKPRVIKHTEEEEYTIEREREAKNGWPE
jgi:hypothetical protein